MLRKVIPFIAAAAMLFGTNALQAQSHCTKAKDAECAKKCEGKKASEKKSEEIQISEVTVDQLSKMIAAGTVTVIDARDRKSYDKGHVDGAIHLASYTFADDKSANLVFYCGGPFCAAAPKAARAAIADGYPSDKISVFTGGWHEWSEVQSQAGL